jgi:hypothetical protein
MGAQVSSYMWLDSTNEWIFFDNDDPGDAFYYSFRHERWTAFNEIPVNSLAGFDRFVTDISGQGIETYLLTPNALGTGGTFTISGTESQGGNTLNITFSGSLDYAAPGPTSGESVVTFDIKTYRLIAIGDRTSTFEGSAQQFYNAYGETIFDEIEFSLNFDGQSSGSYTAVAKFNGNGLAVEDGYFSFE